MRFETLINDIENYPGFVLTLSKMNRTTRNIEIEIKPRKGSLVSCPICGRRCGVYDHQKSRQYEYVPDLGYGVVFIYTPRRANCKKCGQHVEQVPWATGKSPITITKSWYLARWAKRLPWNQVAAIFENRWDQVYKSVKMAVEWGIANRNILNVVALGVDEVYFGIKNKFKTLVYQICSKKPRLLFVADGHKEEAFTGILEKQGEAWCKGIKYVCSDLWRAYLKSINKKLPNALHILDRFHIVARLNKAVDEIRRSEAAMLASKGIGILKNMRYAFLKRPENLTEKQQKGMQKIIKRRNLKSIRAYHWMQSFQLMWEYTTDWGALRFMKGWCKGASRSRLKKIMTFVKTIRKHEQLILNWFRAKKIYSSGIVEAMNRGAGLVSNMARGFRNPEICEIALFHALGDLPMPANYTHRFS